MQIDQNITMTNNPEKPREDTPPLVITVTSEKKPTPICFVGLDEKAPGWSYELEPPIAVRVFSQTSQDMVDAEVHYADPETGICCIMYCTRSGMKWVPMNETVPPLSLVVPKETKTRVNETVQFGITHERTKIAEAMPLEITARDEVVAFHHPELPDIKGIRMLNTPVSVKVYSKTAKAPVSATVDCITTEKVTRCRVRYDGTTKFKFVYLDEVTPELSVRTNENA